MVQSTKVAHPPLDIRLQEIKEKIKQAGLLELFEEALEIQEGFEHLLALSNKNKKMLTTELSGKRPVGRPRKMLLGATTAMQAKKEKREQETTQINQVATATQEESTQGEQGVQRMKPAHKLKDKTHKAPPKTHTTHRQSNSKG
ncbi:hypothetical protein NHP200010_12440 [Helicobacter bizzozeronii]|uniref:hypothetical protein n=1 Tax=Helicobacter bizzozeronii TaxID=56877 RepID=UPI00244D9574|nr:hypothetical protein [Helicobacter bizzozeronii]GMB93522.1 hypothetical protein NHP200010_12440 [Helicobacter bizzozeronii]